MRGIENNQAGAMDERLRHRTGFAAADRPRILRALSALAPHLSGWDQVDLELSLKTPRAQTRRSPFKPG
jgi:hypothetical protein